MDDRQTMLEGDLLQSMAHAHGDKLGVFGLALENESERNDHIALVLCGRHVDHERNLERAGGTEEVDHAVRVDLVKFLAGIVDQPLHEFRVVFARHDGETGNRYGEQFRRAGRKFVRHGAL